MFRVASSLTGGANVFGATAGLSPVYDRPQDPAGGDEFYEAVNPTPAGGANIAQAGASTPVAAAFAMDPWEARFMALKGPVDEIKSSRESHSVKEYRLLALAKTNIIAVTALCYPEDMRPASLKLTSLDLQHMDLQEQLEILCPDPRYAQQMFGVLAALSYHNIQGIHAIYKLYKNDPVGAIGMLSGIANGSSELEHKELAMSYLTKIDDELVDDVLTRVTGDIAEEFRVNRLMRTGKGLSPAEQRSLLANRDHYDSVTSLETVRALYSLITSTDKTTFNTRAFQLLLGGGAEIREHFRNKVFNELTMEDAFDVNSPLVSLWVELAQRFDPTEIEMARFIIHDRAERGVQDGFSIRTSGRMIEILRRIDIAHTIAGMMKNADSAITRAFATLCYYENKIALHHARRERNSHVLTALETEFAMVTEGNPSFDEPFFLDALARIDTDATDEIFAGLRARGLIG